MKPFTMLAIVFFSVIALVHLYRLIQPFEVVVGGTIVPQWVSIVGLIVGAVLALMLSRESRR
jgi:membrane associated rhomboid family serine protease